ncbi:MAG: ABC transporter permease subunit [Symbiopectobacterium sp.]
MRGIDPQLLRVAYSLGASRFRAFWRIFLPLSLPGVAAGSLLVFILSIGFFVTPALMGSPRYTMIAMIIKISWKSISTGASRRRCLRCCYCALYCCFRSMYGS